MLALIQNVPSFADKMCVCDFLNALTITQAKPFPNDGIHEMFVLRALRLKMGNCSTYKMKLLFTLYAHCLHSSTEWMTLPVNCELRKFENGCFIYLAATLTTHYVIIQLKIEIYKINKNKMPSQSLR